MSESVAQGPSTTVIAPYVPRTIVGSKGLVTAINRAMAQQGELRVATNCITRGGWIMPRPPLREYDAGQTPIGFQALFQANGFSAGIAIGGDGKLYKDSGNITDGSSFAGFGSTTFANFQKGCLFVGRGSQYIGTSDTGVWKLDKFDGIATAYKAGLQRGLDITATPTGTTGFLTNGSTAAWKVLWGYIDNNGYLFLGAPGGRYLATASGTNQNVTLKTPIPSEIIAATTPTNYFYMLYRAPQVTTGAPTEEYQLAFQSYVTATDISNGFVQITDVTPDSMLGPKLYTNPSQDTALFENSQPPLAACGAYWKGCSWWGNTTRRHRYEFAMLATPDTLVLNGAGGQVQAATPIAGQATYTFTSAATYDFSGIDTSNILSVVNCTNAGNNGQFAVVSVNSGTRQIVVTNGGAVNEAAPPATAKALCAGLTIAAVRYNAVWAEDIANKRYAVGASGTTSTDVQTTAQSLIRCINYNAAATVYGYDVSSVDTAPGFLRIEARSLGGSAFTVQAFGNKTSAASGPSVYGSKFAPDLNAARTSANQATQNRLYRSKSATQSGGLEAVPESNYDDIGDGPKIRWIVPLRDSNYIFTDSGLFRVTGDGVNFDIALLSPTTLLIGIPCVFEDAIYAVTTRGLVQITDAGSIVPIDGAIRPDIEQWIGFWFGDGKTAYGNDGSARVGASPQSRLIYFSLCPKDTVSNFQTLSTCFVLNVDEGTWSIAKTNFQASTLDGQTIFTQSFLSGGRLWWCGPTSAGNCGIWTEEPINTRDTRITIPQPCKGIAPPGERRSIKLSAVTATTVTIDTTDSSSKYTPVLNDVLLSNLPGAGQHAGGAWIVTNVAGAVLTLASYLTKAGDTVNGTGGFATGRALAVDGSYSMTVQPHAYVAGDEGGTRLFSEVDVLMSDDSTADAVTILLGSEVAAGSLAPPLPTTATKLYNIRSSVPTAQQACSRLYTLVIHSQPLKYLLIEGVSYRYQDSEGIPLA